MHTRSEMIEQWLAYATRMNCSEPVFMAGIGLVNADDNAEYYGRVGLDCLLRAAEIEVNGPRSIRQYLEPTKRY